MLLYSYKCVKFLLFTLFILFLLLFPLSEFLLMRYYKNHSVLRVIDQIVNPRQTLLPKAGG